ncbi:MAG: hypothetical protein KF819_39775 [Labilithrix sp.]|nr:hypothetical protein [Labilithrix sp.]
MGRRSMLGAMATLFAVPACAPRAPEAPLAPRPASGVDMLVAGVRPIAKDRALYPVPGRPDRSAIYDDAMAVLVLLRQGRRREAGAVLAALADAQLPDGAIPFNVSLTTEPANPYVRTGALAWVGYAAVEYLESAKGGADRDAIIAMAHRLAAFLLARRIDALPDPRARLVTGGRGVYRYEIASGALRESFVDGERDWVATEHNVDAFFFLRALGRISEQRAYASAADEIAASLVAGAWSEREGQLARGVTAEGVDAICALDGASWGGLMLLARGDRARAERSFSTADARYASSSTRVPHARGHKPYARGPLIESYALRSQTGGRFASAMWDDFATVWPEGSAGVALLAARLGRRDRAKEILARLDALRGADGSLPTATDAIPTELDTSPSIAGTAWCELVRHELEGGVGIWI